MHIQEKSPGDRLALMRLVRGERCAEQRDRCRVVLLVLEGLETRAIQDRVGRSRGFVQRWAYAYRDGGLAALAARPRGGSAPKLPPEKHSVFLERFKAGPIESDDGVCRLGGKDAVRILQAEFGVDYTLTGAYELLHRLGLSCLRPRPRHRKSDPQAQKQWLERAPFLSTKPVKNTRRNKSKSGSRTKPASDSKAP